MAESLLGLNALADYLHRGSKSKRKATPVEDGSTPALNPETMKEDVTSLPGKTQKTEVLPCKTTEKPSESPAPAILTLPHNTLASRSSAAAAAGKTKKKGNGILKKIRKECHLVQKHMFQRLKAAAKPPPLQPKKQVMNPRQKYAKYYMPTATQLSIQQKR